MILWKNGSTVHIQNVLKVRVTRGLNLYELIRIVT